MRTKRFERHVMAIAVLAAASSLSQAAPASAKSKTKATSRQSVGGPTREACDNAMSFMSYNVIADNTCPQSLAVPDYSHAVKVCTSAFGEKSVTAAALRGVKEFKSNLEQEGRDDLCPKLQTFLQQYTPPAWTQGDQRDASAERQTEERSKGDNLKAIRSINMDFCFPADGAEYRALGKNGILRLEASSASPSELPLEKAYLKMDGDEVPLFRISHSDKIQERRSGSKTWKEVSFYIVPLVAVSRGVTVMADFSGQTGFEVGELDSSDDMPEFFRPGADSTPTAPETAALRKLLKREYPDDFSD